MKILLAILTICFYSGEILGQSDQNLRDAISGFNDVVSNSTLAISNCDKRSPPEVQYQEGDDANKLYEKVELSLEGPLPTQNYEGDQISVISKEQAENLFKEFSEVGYMHFDYLHAGCEIRAHEFAMIAKANGIEMGKAMTVYGDGERGGLFPSEWIEMEKKGEKIPVPDGFVGWRHHVAPYVLVRDGDVVKPFVFDIGVAEKIKPLDEWRGSLINATQEETKTFVRDRAVIHPSQGPRTVEESYISTEINKQKLIREMGIWEFEYWDEKGLLNY